MDELEYITNTEIKKHQQVLERIKQFGNYIDIKTGSMGAAIMGPVVFSENYHHGIMNATTAGLKQALYTMLIGGAIVKGAQYIADNVDMKYVGKALGVAIPSAITITATYGVHSLKGTVDPVESTIPTATIAPMGFLYAVNQEKINNAVKKIYTAIKTKL